MHIVLVIKSLIVAKGGAERFTCNLIRGLKGCGHQLSVCCHEWDAAAEQFGVQLIKVPETRTGRHPWYEFTKNVEDIIKTLSAVDVVFGLTQVMPQDVHRLGGGVYRYWYNRKYGKMMPLQMLRSRVRNCLNFEKEMYSKKNLKHAITISDMDRKILVELLGMDPACVHTIYNGFDFEEFNLGDRGSARQQLTQTLKLNPSKKIVLFAANNYVRKGLPQAVESLINTESPDDFSLVVIGKSRNSIKKRLQKKIGDKFEAFWLDHVKNPADFYRGADLMLFPTLYDSFANVIGEALLCGLPVITTAQAGGSEMVVPGTNGFVVSDANEIKEMTGYLNQINDFARLKDMSAAADIKVKDLSIEKCALNTERILALAAKEK